MSVMERQYSEGEVAVRAFRGETVESEHRVSVAVVDAEGNLTHYFGNPYFQTMARSSIKPFQLLPLLTTGAADHFGFTTEQLAIMCGSHNGTDRHREVVRSNLERSGSSASDLQCGTHLPIAMRLEGKYPCHGEDKDPLRHNCSGKHSGFLALASHMGVDVREYLHPQSRSQTLVREAVAQMTTCPVGDMTIAIDGCSAPNFSTTPYHLAVGFGKLAQGKGWESTVDGAVRRVREAMWQFPELVSGEKRFDLDLMRSFPNEVVCKVGAEAIEGIGFASSGLGIGVKIHDGNSRALWPVCVEVLRQLGIVANMSECPCLKQHVRPEIRNYRSLVTGELLVAFKLRSV